METSGTDVMNDSDVRAPISPLHLAVSTLTNPREKVGVTNRYSAS